MYVVINKIDIIFSFLFFLFLFTQYTHTVADARIVNPPFKIPGFEVIPDLQQSAENVYAWNLGRHAIRQVGKFYSLRVQAFLGLYMFLLTAGILVFIIDAIIKVSGGGTVPLTCEMISVGFLVMNFTLICFIIIRAGIQANRQPKLHKSAITHYRTRLSQHVKMQAKQLRRLISTGGDVDGTEEEGNEEKIKKLKQSLKSLLGREKELQSALKYVANELDSESETEKLRIIGFPVDTRMLEGLVGLISGLALTLWQIFQR